MRLDFKAAFIDFNTICLETPKDFAMHGNIYLSEDSLTLLKINKVKKQKNGVKYYLKYEFLKLNLNVDYHIILPNSQSVLITYEDIVYTKTFDQHFSNVDLQQGSYIVDNKTHFRVFAPISKKMYVKYVDSINQEVIMPLTRNHGFFEGVVEKNLHGALYNYINYVNGNIFETVDPYCISASLNSENSVVVDLNILNKVKRIKGVVSKKDSIIYEAHVRDFSISPSANIEAKGKFGGLVEKGTLSNLGFKTGIDYVLDLGVTHLQLLPIFDFGSVDERHGIFYNWGYDPVLYNVVEGSYVSGVDPISRILELQDVVSKLHDYGLFVNMDVVYNHVYDKESSAFEKLVPNYYFRKDSNGSFCGNDVRSESLMMSHFIVSSVVFWADFYGFDGFRFDLMGLIDVKTLKALQKALNGVDSNIMVYGEGWDMPTLLSSSLKSTMFNKKLSNVGFFNDQFRDVIKGATMVEDVLDRGLLGGVFSSLSCAKILGSFDQFNGLDSINYLECHDNHSLVDKLVLSGSDFVYRRAMLGNVVVLLAQGIPFIHMGQEFFRTKHFEHNTYNLGDFYNAVDYDLKDSNIVYVELFKKVVNFRRTNSDCFFDCVSDLVSCEYIGVGVIKYVINRFSVYFNFSDVDFNIDLKNVVLENGYDSKLLSLSFAICKN